MSKKHLAKLKLKKQKKNDRLLKKHKQLVQKGLLKPGEDFTKKKVSGENYGDLPNRSKKINFKPKKKKEKSESNKPYYSHLLKKDDEPYDPAWKAKIDAEESKYRKANWSRFANEENYKKYLERNKIISSLTRNINNASNVVEKAKGKKEELLAKRKELAKKAREAYANGNTEAYDKYCAQAVEINAKIVEENSKILDIDFYTDKKKGKERLRELKEELFNPIVSEKEYENGKVVEKIRESGASEFKGNITDEEYNIYARLIDEDIENGTNFAEEYWKKLYKEKINERQKLAEEVELEIAEGIYNEAVKYTPSSHKYILDDISDVQLDSYNDFMSILNGYPTEFRNLFIRCIDNLDDDDFRQFLNNIFINSGMLKAAGYSSGSSDGNGNYIYNGGFNVLKLIYGDSTDIEKGIPDGVYDELVKLSLADQNFTSMENKLKNNYSSKKIQNPIKNTIRDYIKRIKK